MEKDNLAAFYFHQGTNYFAYDYLGVNRLSSKNEYLYSFRTWAPRADSVALVSDFTGWDKPLLLRKITDKGIYELIYKSDKSLEGCNYKFKISRGSSAFLKGDPYARLSRGGSDGASVIYTDTSFDWDDANWLKHRRKSISSDSALGLQVPINIYELHLGSFMRKPDGEYYSYREMANILPPYVKAMGYTHVEFLPLTEYPYDASWGYQVCSYFAPTSRFGSPCDLKHLINELHKSGTGVILDWVPAHFPKDEWGLYEFDGSPLYEYQGSDRMESDTWGTRFFDLGREEIQSFLISSAMYFLREYHIDGIRVDAVASMIYLDYDRRPGAWIPNYYGGRENLEAIAFLKKLNAAIVTEFDDVLIIAEESSDFPGVTRPVTEGGLGFSLKWNMGFSNDLFDYIKTDPIYRKYKHRALTFPIMYSYNEYYLLPISHDETVHGKKSFIDKFFGSYEDKFLQMRETLLLIMTFPGKKLMFMGGEFAQFREWSFQDSLEWFMLDYDTHHAMRDYVQALNHFYLSHSELWEMDFHPSGFEWILSDEEEKNIIAYRRISTQNTSLAIIINFSAINQSLEYIQKKKKAYVVFESRQDSSAKIKAENNMVSMTLGPYSGIILKEQDYDYELKA